MKVVVVGVGHALGGDDFVGIRVVEELSYEVKEKNVEFLTTMDPSRIIYLLEEYDLMIVVDAVIGEKAGEVYIIPSGDYPKHLKPISSHGFGVVLALETARRLGINVDNKVRIVGITISEIVMYEEKLSQDVEKAVPKAKEVVKKLIYSF
ncbi:MAG: hydrogenase maturation protease [Spirochaetia bacterium]|nr:hydrogenase maturation protease [Spirochaetota bacterium]MCX8097301.1 hydrogenase maturation protease [Spirochaetota bacterium]MDW8112850.1 hydrogenase maturation protease [Spirochaetia bacterium]